MILILVLLCALTNIVSGMDLTIRSSTFRISREDNRGIQLKIDILKEYLQKKNELLASTKKNIEELENLAKQYESDLANQAASTNSIKQILVDDTKSKIAAEAKSLGDIMSDINVIAHLCKMCGISLLHIAAFFGYLEIIKLLDITNENGKLQHDNAMTAWLYAAKNGHKNVTKYLTQFLTLNDILLDDKISKVFFTYKM